MEILTNPELIANYLAALEDINIIKRMTFYGREIKLLSENSYIFDVSIKKFKTP